MQYTYEKLFDLAECNISRNNHIAWNVRAATCSVLPHVALGQNVWRSLAYMKGYIQG